MNFTSTLPSYREEVATAKEAVRRRLELASRSNPFEETTPTASLLVGSGLALGLGLLALNRCGMFHPTRFARRRMNRYALYATGQRLAAMPRELGARMGLVRRKPATFKHRLAAWMGTAVGNLDHAKHLVEETGGHAFQTVRDGLHDTRINSARLVRDHPAATVGAGLLTVGLLAAAIMAPNYLD